MRTNRDGHVRLALKYLIRLSTLPSCHVTTHATNSIISERRSIRIGEPVTTSLQIPLSILSSIVVVFQTFCSDASDVAGGYRTWEGYPREDTRGHPSLEQKGGHIINCRILRGNRNGGEQLRSLLLMILCSTRFS